MEYNKTKKTIDKVAGIFGIISAIVTMVLSIIFIIVAISYFSGAHDYTQRLSYYDYWGEHYYYEIVSMKSAVYLLLSLDCLCWVLIF